MANSDLSGSSAQATRHSSAPRWLFTVMTAVIAVGLRVALQPWLGDQLPFLFAYPAVVLAATNWGLANGLAVAAACAVAVMVPWIPPEVEPESRPQLIIAFLFSAFFVSLVCSPGAREVRAAARAATSDSPSASFASPLEAWLRAVLWGSVLIPFAVFVAAAWWGYERARNDAEAAAARAAVLVRGQAEHTFDIARDIARRADAASLADDAAVRRDEAQIHVRLADMVAGLPSVVNLNVWDADGRPLARSDRYPTNRVAGVGDRAYFLAQKPAGAPLGISEVVTGRQTGLDLVNVALRRTSPNGHFRGAVCVSLSPAFFRDYFRALANENPTLARFSLVRTDGAILASWPQYGGHEHVVPGDEIFALVAAGKRSGSLLIESHRDGLMRFVSFQRVGDYPLYVVAGVSQAAMLSNWLHYVGLLAALLVPVTAGLAYVSLVALRKTRRERAMAAELGDAVRRRAAAEKGMQESQKLETLAQLTGGVAHDFNNLLAIVSSSLHVHRHLHPDLADERQVQAMHRAVQSGTRLTRQLLSFSRKQALRPETIELPVWLPGAEGLLRSTLGSRIDMEIVVEPDVHPIHVDVAELELALINLSINARHAMPGGGRLRIGARNEYPRADGQRRPPPEGVESPGGAGSARERSQADDQRHLLPEEAGTARESAVPDSAARVVVSVSDTGSGIPAEVLPRVFEPFFTTRMHEAGSGLGLSQVHGFCAQAGGLARIASVVGEGTTVEMVLPARPRAASAASPRETSGAESLAGHVLLVEDNEDVALSTTAILESAGLRVTHHWSADAALAALRGGASLPELVLSDIEMPGKLSGMELAFRLRDEFPGLPVILVTGYAKQLDDALAGGLRVLSKPVPPADLLRELRSALDRRARAVAGDASSASSMAP